MRVVFTCENDGADDGDGVERVGQGHQGCVQQRGNAADDFKSDKRSQHENVEAGKQIQLHDFASSFIAADKAGRAKNSLTRSLTTSPPRVNIVSRTISSFMFNCSFPSFTRCSTNALTFRAYIWLACYGTGLAICDHPIMVKPCSTT